MEERRWRWWDGECSVVGGVGNNGVKLNEKMRNGWDGWC